MTTTPPATHVTLADRTVRRVGLGTMTALTGPGHWWHPEDLDAVRTLLRGAVEAGIDHIDTADAYGPETAEHLIRKALHPYPEHLLIATKGGLTRPGPNRWERCGRPEYLRQAVALSLRRLKTDRLDLYYLHRIDPAVPLADQLGALADLRTEGKIGHIGISQVTTHELAEARTITPIAAVQCRYHTDDQASRAVLDACAQTGTVFVTHSPLGQGATLNPAANRSSDPVTALRSTLALGDHVTVIPGTRSLTHLRQNLTATTRSSPCSESARWNRGVATTP